MHEVLAEEHSKLSREDSLSAAARAAHGERDFSLLAWTLNESCHPPSHTRRAPHRHDRSRLDVAHLGSPLVGGTPQPRHRLKVPDFY